ncbi:MAG: hypothetical protein ACFFDN_05745 [Candidatus Hodarchaeota archaeon]
MSEYGLLGLLNDLVNNELEKEIIEIIYRMDDQEKILIEILKILEVN